MTDGKLVICNGTGVGRLVICAACNMPHVIGTKHVCPIYAWVPGLMAINTSLAKGMKPVEVYGK